MASDTEVAALVSLLRLDLSALIENHQGPPPVLFESVEHLAAWASKVGLDGPEPVPEAPSTSACRLRGLCRLTRKDPTFAYDQVWTRVTYSAFPRQLLEIACKGLDVDEVARGNYRPDHVVHQAGADAVPDAWAMVLPVYEDAHSPFDDIERRLVDVQPGFGCLLLPPLVALKLYSGRLPRSVTELLRLMYGIRGQMDNDAPRTAAYCDQIQSEAMPFMPRRLSAGQRRRPSPFY